MSVRELILFGFVIHFVLAQGDSGYDFVNPLIGTTNGGHVFPGATLPFSMAKAGPDCTGENQGGFASDNSTIIGFSHLHDSGTGGNPSLGLFPIFPQSGCPANDINNCKFTQDQRAIGRGSNVAARPGYFGLDLANGIMAEMTVTNHTALYRFTFPERPVYGYNGTNGMGPDTLVDLEPVMLLELIDLPKTRSKAYISVDPETGRMTGNGTFKPSFGVGQYKAYFCADWQGASIKSSGVFADTRAGASATYIKVLGHGVDSLFPAGAYVQFDRPHNSNQILARVGMSFISSEQACSNAEKEIPTFDFDGTLAAAQEAWNEKLSVVSIDTTGVDRSYAEIFWSGIYRSMISPQDYTGENQLWNSTEPYYDSIYCGWDSFRSMHQLITLLDPETQTNIVRTLIDTYRHEGWLPDCRMSFCKGYTQGGSNADVILADSYLKGIKNGVDWKTGYEALFADAESEPPNWNIEGRGGLQSWKNLHYIPTDDFDIAGIGLHTRSISRTVEYAYNDFCIAQIAKDLDYTDDYNKYLERSGYWKNMFKADQISTINGQDTGFTGFLQPKYLNGTWGIQDPAFCSPLLNFTSCYLSPDGGETYEGSIWLYTFFVPQDMATLITILGGRDNFVRRLDYLHESGLLYIGDEQGFLPVFQYHHAGRPGKSAQRVHAYIPSQFNTTLSGIPGNDDSGAMGSFAALSMAGIFPNPGQNIYYITPPFFQSISITNKQTGKTATIKNVNFDPGYKNIYIQNASLDGVPYTRNWLTHEFFLNGGTLELVLGDAESAWGTGLEDVPPSYSSSSNSTEDYAGRR